VKSIAALKAMQLCAKLGGLGKLENDPWQ